MNDLVAARASIERIAQAATQRWTSALSVTIAEPLAIYFMVGAVICVVMGTLMLMSPRPAQRVVAFCVIAAPSVLLAWTGGVGRELIASLGVCALAWLAGHAVLELCQLDCGSSSERVAMAA